MVARAGLGRISPTFHSNEHWVQRQCMTTLLRSPVTLASRVHTELAAHSGQGLFTSSPFYFGRAFGSKITSMFAPAASRLMLRAFEFFSRGEKYPSCAFQRTQILFTTELAR
jgi:hypothetical protein